MVNRVSLLDLNLLVGCSRSVMSLFVLPVPSRSSSFLSQSKDLHAALTGVSYLAVRCESVSPVSVLPCDELTKSFS